MLHRDSGHYRRWIHIKHHSPSYSAHNGVRWGRRPMLHLSARCSTGGRKKVASAIVRRIPINMVSFVNIITWDCLKKLKYSGREIVLLVHLTLGFRRQEVNPTGMIRLPLHFGDKAKARTPEVNFLVVDVPTTYNVILGCPGLIAFITRGHGLAIQRRGLLVAQTVLFSFSFSKRQLYLATASFDLWRFDLRSPIYPRRRTSDSQGRISTSPGQKRMASASPPSMLEQRPGKYLTRLAKDWHQQIT
ncbi:hypothetical protein Cgig2_014191 [Carnegiea gigantea]|uniref:Uncharacterized protein n=1 Tax=Carnegiea gigantea TaxID=171969 RepID=A0A9Q1JYD4_9CARY|nr:hypothetical protein Cgig2_014191 [Carnegiea gigantea]